MSMAKEQKTVMELGGNLTIIGDITRIHIIDGKLEIVSVPRYDHSNLEEIKGTQEYIEKYFPIVKASSLSLEDEFLKHEAETEHQINFKHALIMAIKSGLTDFRAQRMDPSMNEEGGIYYKAGSEPALDISPNDWFKIAKEFMPEKESRLGTKRERIAFLGLLIRYLIEEKGYDVKEAWRAVCDQSKDLGHYRDSKKAKHYFETTGSRPIGEWYDLANTSKITANTETNAFSVLGGCWHDYGNKLPLVDEYDFICPESDYFGSVGWIVLPVEIIKIMSKAVEQKAVIEVEGKITRVSINGTQYK